MDKRNEICGITGLPIHPGDSVAAFVLQAHGPVAVSGYPDDFYTPVGFPIFGVYDGNGGLENPKTSVWNDFALRLLKEQDKDCPVMFVHIRIYHKLITNIGTRYPNHGKIDYRSLVRSELVAKARLNRLPIIGRNLFFAEPYPDEITARVFYNGYHRTDDIDEQCIETEAAVDCHLFYHALLLLHKNYMPSSDMADQNEETALQAMTAEFILDHVNSAGKGRYEETISYR